MKITIETPLPGEEDEIIIRMAELSDEVLKTVSRLKDGANHDTIAVNLDENIVMLPIKEILYFELLQSGQDVVRTGRGSGKLFLCADIQELDREYQDDRAFEPRV